MTSGEGSSRFSPSIPSVLVGVVFFVLHLVFQIFALLQSYVAGMAHFDDPLSRQAAWESRFWERATTVATFAEVLRDSYWVQHLTLDDLVPRARRLEELLPDDEDVAEFTDLVETAAELAE